MNAAAAPLSWWMSFADPSRPKGQQWLSCAIVEASTPEGAIAVSHSSGVNPGHCEVALAVIPPATRARIPAEFVGRRLSRDDTERLDIIMASPGVHT